MDVSVPYEKGRIRIDFYESETLENLYRMFSTLDGMAPGAYIENVGSCERLDGRKGVVLYLKENS